MYFNENFSDTVSRKICGDRGARRSKSSWAVAIFPETCTILVYFLKLFFFYNADTSYRLRLEVIIIFGGSSVRVSVLQENLAKGLSIVGRAVASRSTLPVLNNILIETDNSQLKLSAMDMEIAINCWVGAMIEDEGQITVPARLLSDFVNSLPNDRIDMELQTRTQTLHLHCARYEANIKGIDATEFPIIPTYRAIWTRPAWRWSRASYAA